MKFYTELTVCTVQLTMRYFIGFLFLVSPGYCARILAILPIAVKSHYVVMEPLLQALAARGHQVTVYSSFPQKTPLANLTDVDCSEGRRIHVNNFDFDSIKNLLGNAIKDTHHIMNLIASDCEDVFKKSPLRYFDYNREHYDLVIAEMFGGDCYVHFANKLNVPLISIVTSVPLPWIPDLFGIPDNPSYIPNSLMDLPPEMTFVERIINTFVINYAKVMFNLVSNSRIQKLAEEYFQEGLPWVGDMARNSSLLLVNSHFSLSQSRPLPPNVIDIGGIHIKEQRPLPMDLKAILDNSTQGAILFSFGSMIRISSLPKEKVNMILRVFSKLPQTLIMKYEDTLPDVPNNVVIKNWLPQRDILEHKNVVAFVSHGGLASVMEAVYCAKPVVGIPFFSDQFININSLAWKGAAVKVDIDTISEQDFEHALHEVTNNPKILERIKTLSQQFRDRPLSALQSAVYWTEYVLRHKGAPHLRPASTTLPSYQLWLLDVIAVLLVTLAIVIYSAQTIVRCVISLVTRQQLFNPYKIIDRDCKDD